MKKWKGEEVQLLKELKDKLKNHVKNEVAVADACEVKRQPEVEEVAPEVVCRQVLLARKLEEMNEHQAAKAKSLVDRDKDKEAAKVKAKEEAKAAAKAMAAKTLAANPVFIGEAGTPEEVNPDGFTDPGARAMYLQARDRKGVVSGKGGSRGGRRVVGEKRSE